MRRYGEIAFCVGLTLAGCGWALLIVGGPILGDMSLVKIAAGFFFGGMGLCMAMGIASLWSDILGRR
jgi:hypothetical protein